MRCSIIIPTYNHLEDCLKPCIESLLKYTNLDDIEVIVVANGCTDGTKEFLNSIPQIKVLWFDEPLGFTKASNIGANEATGDYLIFLNNDTVLLNQPPNQWIDILLNPFIKNIALGATGPHLLDFIGYKFIVGFCLATPRKLFGLIGFNEIYSPGTGEDIEYCIILQNSGYVISRVPNEEDNAFPIYHKAEGTINDKREEWSKTYQRNMEILRRKKYEGTL